MKNKIILEQINKTLNIFPEVDRVEAGRVEEDDCGLSFLELQACLCVLDNRRNIPVIGNAKIIVSDKRCLNKISQRKTYQGIKYKYNNIAPFKAKKYNGLHKIMLINKNLFYDNIYYLYKRKPYLFKYIDSIIIGYGGPNTKGEMMSYVEWDNKSKKVYVSIENFYSHRKKKLDWLEFMARMVHELAHVKNLCDFKSDYITSLESTKNGLAYRLEVYSKGYILELKNKNETKKYEIKKFDNIYKIDFTPENIVEFEKLFIAIPYFYKKKFSKNTYKNNIIVQNYLKEDIYSYSLFFDEYLCECESYIFCLERRKMFKGYIKKYRKDIKKLSSGFFDIVNNEPNIRSLKIVTRLEERINRMEKLLVELNF